MTSSDIIFIAFMIVSVVFLALMLNRAGKGVSGREDDRDAGS